MHVDCDGQGNQEGEAEDDLDRVTPTPALAEDVPEDSCAHPGCGCDQKREVGLSPGEHEVPDCNHDDIEQGLPQQHAS